MSRIGKLPIQVPSGVIVNIDGQNLKVNGPKGELNMEISRKIKIEQNENVLNISRVSDDKPTRALHGLWRVLIANAVKGVSEGWVRQLDFKGVGFRAEVQDNKLILNVGFSHPVEIEAPSGIEFNVTKNIISVAGIDKQLVGQVAANIRRVKPVEPYKGKGIKYIEEIPRRKLGKAAKAASGSA